MRVYLNHGNNFELLTNNNVYNAPSGIQVYGTLALPIAQQRVIMPSSDLSHFFKSISFDILHPAPKLDKNLDGDPSQVLLDQPKINPTSHIHSTPCGCTLQTLIFP
jgi:hypothetical protein